jgi:hypothetical protein
MNRLPQPWPGGKFRWPRFSALWRTPVDDTHTMVFSVCFTPRVDGKLPDLPPGLTYDITDQLLVHREQDYQAIASQGRITARTTEKLATSDGGVILLRKLAMEGIRAVQAGRDPQGVRRPEKNSEGVDQIIDLERVVEDDLNKMTV